MSIFLNFITFVLIILGIFCLFCALNKGVQQKTINDQLKYGKCKTKEEVEKVIYSVTNSFALYGLIFTVSGFGLLVARLFS